VTRTLVLLALVLALPPGTTLAFCLQGLLEADCCCSGNGCDEPAPATMQAMPCCDVPNAATVPAGATSTASSLQKLHDAPSATGLDTVAAHAIGTRSNATRAPAFPPAELFTLHAAFLI
jgi:hypothetical protein